MSDGDPEPVSTDEILVGRPARVTLVSDDHLTFYCRLQGGGMARIVSSTPAAVSRGDSVIIGDAAWSVIPTDSWVDERSVGIVRKVRKKGVTLETAIGIRHLRVKPRKSLHLQPGNTVEFDEMIGVSNVLSRAPIRVRDNGSDDFNEADELQAIEPDTSLSFASFGGYPSVIARARELVETQLEKRSELDSLGARAVRGVILTGPPGTGKTYLAQIIASVSKSAFYAVSGPSVLSKWLGDSELFLRRLFEKASKQPRSIIFFDEIDSIAGRRGDDLTGNSKRLVAQLLTLMDGFSDRGNVVVMAATNRIDDVDDALLRPGRFDWRITFDAPTEEDRLAILTVGADAVTTTGDLPLTDLASITEGWTGAMISALWTEGALLAVQDGRSSVTPEDMARAYERVDAASPRNGA